MKRYPIVSIIVIAFAFVVGFSLSSYTSWYNTTCAYQLGFERGCDTGYIAGVGDTKEEISKRIFDYMGEGDTGTEFEGYAIQGIPLDSAWYNEVYMELTHKDE